MSEEVPIQPSKPPKPQCFAYSQDGHRCERSAGHRGYHEMRIAWLDEECAVPTAQAPAVRPQSPARAAVIEEGDGYTLTENGFVLGPSTPREAVPGAPCIVCSHAHAGADCTHARCDCQNYIG